MKRIILLLLLPLALSACVSSGKPIRVAVANSTCAGTPKGHTPAELTYRLDNKLEMSMKLKWDAGENTEFRIKLKPKGSGTDNVLVETIAVSVDPPPVGGVPPIAWMNKQGTARNLPDSTLVLCVPAGVATGTVFKFDINVGGIGTIDPRVEVTW